MYFLDTRVSFDAGGYFTINLPLFKSVSTFLFYMQIIVTRARKIFIKKIFITLLLFFIIDFYF